MTLRAQPHQGDEEVVALLHGQMHMVRRSALAGARSVGDLPSLDEAEVLSFVFEQILRISRKGQAIGNIRALSWQIGRRKALDLYRRKEVAAAWVRHAAIVQRVQAESHEEAIARADLAVKVLKRVGSQVFHQALQETPSDQKERKRISRARQSLRQAASELG